MSDDLFEMVTPDEDTTVDPNKDYVAEFIGDDKKYKTVSEAAFAIANKDAFIERLKRENAALRQESAAKGNLEELVTKLAETKASPQPDPEPAETVREAPINIEEQISSIIARREAENRQSQNKGYVKNELVKAFGPNYSVHLVREAERLGMTTDQMNNLAAASPAAFLRLVGIGAVKASEDIVPPVSATTAQHFKKDSGPAKTRSYYREIMKKDKALFLSPKIQNEMHDQMMRLGDQFND